jgi:protocatechuate 3,4-dioxygenase beta subunit
LYVIAAGNPGEAVAWLPKLKRNDAAPNWRFRERSERPRIRILPNESKRLDIDLEPIVDFRMKFIDSLTGEPVPDVHFQVNDDYPGVTGQSDPTGSLAIRSLPAGEYTCFVHANGYYRGWADDAAPRWRNAASSEFPRGSLGKVVSLHHMVTFDLARDMPEATFVLERQVTISGRVLDPDGKPVQRATVNLVRAATETLPGGPERRQFYVKPDGNFTAELPPSGIGPYHLMVHDQGVEQAEKGRFQFDGTERRAWANGVGPRMETTAGQTIDNVELRLTRPGIIRGRVVDKTGKPLARVSVQSMAADNREGAEHNPATHSDG